MSGCGMHAFVELLVSESYSIFIWCALIPKDLARRQLTHFVEIPCLHARSSSDVEMSRISLHTRQSVSRLYQFEIEKLLCFSMPPMLLLRLIPTPRFPMNLPSR